MILPKIVSFNGRKNLRISLLWFCIKIDYLFGSASPRIIWTLSKSPLRLFKYRGGNRTSWNWTATAWCTTFARSVLSFCNGGCPGLNSLFLFHSIMLFRIRDKFLFFKDEFITPQDTHIAVIFILIMGKVNYILVTTSKWPVGIDFSICTIKSSSHY